MRRGICVLLEECFVLVKRMSGRIVFILNVNFQKKLKVCFGVWREVWFGIIFRDCLVLKMPAVAGWENG